MSKKRMLRRDAVPNHLGQHFMHHKKTIQDIVALAKIGRNDTVVELGAGKGALTLALSQQAGKIIAVEYDADLVQVLKDRMSHMPNTKVLNQDVLTLRLPRESFIVVSNIPYAITTPIMKMLLNRPNSGLKHAVLVMEKGAAKRFTAPFIKDPYVIAWRMWFDINYVRGIPRTCFAPPPKVESAMITVTRKREGMLGYGDCGRFYRLARFVLKRPFDSLDISLKGVFTPPQVKHLRRNLRVSPEMAVGALDERQWREIYETMIRHVPRIHWP